MAIELCDYCEKPLVTKTQGRGYTVLGCKRGCSCYRTIDNATGQQLPQKPVRAADSTPWPGTIAQQGAGDSAGTAVIQSC